MKKIYSPITTISNMIGNVSAAAKNLIVNSMPPNFFNHVYIDTRATSIEQRNKKKKLIGFRPPALALKPNLDLSEGMLTTMELMPFSEILFKDQSKDLLVETMIDRVKIPIEIRMKIESRLKLYDTIAWLRQRFTYRTPFTLNDHIMESTIPSSLIKELMKIYGYSLTIPDLDEFITVLNTITCREFEIIKKFNVSTGKYSVVYRHPENLLMMFEDLPSFDFDKENFSDRNNYIGLNLSVELWNPFNFKSNQAYIDNTLTSFPGFSYQSNEDIYRSILLDRSTDNDNKSYVKQILESKNIYNNSMIDPIAYKNFLDDTSNTFLTHVPDSYKKTFEEYMKTTMTNYILNQISSTEFLDDIEDEIKDNKEEDLLFDTSLARLPLHNETEKEYSFLSVNGRTYQMSKFNPNPIDFVYPEFSEHLKAYYEEHNITPVNVPDYVEGLRVSTTTPKFTLPPNVTIFTKQPEVEDIYKLYLKNLKNSGEVYLNYLLQDDAAEVTISFDGKLQLSDYDEQQRKLMYYSYYVSDINEKIETLDLSDQFDNEFKIFLNFIKDTKETELNNIFNVQIYSRSNNILEGSKFIFSWDTFLVTLKEEHYNVGYIIGIYADMVKLDYWRNLFLEQ